MLYLKRLNYLLNRLKSDGSYIVKSLLSNFRHRYRYVINDIIHRKRNRVVIYTLGKCGSTSVQFSLCKYLKTSRVNQAHFLSEKELAKLRKDQFASLHLRAKRVNTKLSKAQPQNVEFITIVRNPFDRDLSSFFQNRNWYKKFDTNSSNLKDYLNKNSDMSLNWIFDELIPNFGLRIEDFENLPENGRWIDLSSGSRLLVLRYELLRESLEYHFPGFNLMRLNSADQKQYSGEKLFVEKTFKIPSEYKSRVESSGFYKLFYND